VNVSELCIPKTRVITNIECMTVVIVFILGLMSIKVLCVGEINGKSVLFFPIKYTLVCFICLEDNSAHLEGNRAHLVALCPLYAG